MHGTPLAVIDIPTAGECLAVLGPIVALVLLRGLFHLIDHLLRRSANMEWQRQLGWLNIRTERQAAAILRWLGYTTYALLAAALYGIVWGAESLRDLKQWSDPEAMGNLLTRLPVLSICLGAWLIYLGIDLLPKLRREHEIEELENFRAEQAGLEQETAPFAVGPRPKSPLEIWNQWPVTPPSRPSRRR